MNDSALAALLSRLRTVADNRCGYCLALQLNHFIALSVRENWIAVGWHPPTSN